MALLQRMIADQKIGLNYDSMGFAEFEFGATSLARGELAAFTLDKTINAKRIKFKGTWGVTTVAFNAVLIGETEFVDRMGPELKVTIEKSFMRDSDPGIIGWMNVGRDQHKFIIFRDDDNFSDNVDRLEKFLAPFVLQVEEARKTA